MYANLAKSLKLDEQAFAECLKDPEQGKALEASIAESERLGVHGTPHFFIGRIEGGHVVDAERITGAQDTEVFVRAIERVLQ